MDRVLPFHKRRYNAYRINTNLGDVSSDTFTAICRDRPDESGNVIFTFSIDTSEAATGYITITFDASGVDVPNVIGYVDPKRVTGGSAVPLFDYPLAIDLMGTTTP